MTTTLDYLAVKTKPRPLWPVFLCESFSSIGAVMLNGAASVEVKENKPEKK